MGSTRSKTMPDREEPAEDAPIPAEDEPEPDWAEEIRRLRAERGKRLADRLEEPNGRIRERSMSHVFPRVLTRTLPTAVSAEGVWIVDADGRRYLDGSGGAIVVGVGHGDASLIAAADEQLRRTQYAHATMFTTDAVEGYADERGDRAAHRGCP